MFNDWFKVFGLTVHGYGVMIAVGILAAFFYAERQARKHGLDPAQIDNSIYAALIGGWAGAKLVYILINWQIFLQNPLAVLGSSGWVVYGGIIFGILSVYVYCRVKKLSFIDYFNELIPALALAQGFGRIGCFLAGCCYGLETHSHFSVVFPAGSLAPSGIHLIPTQLISSFGDFLLFAILYKIRNSENGSSRTGFWYLILYSAGRFLVEFLRGDIERGSIGIFSTSQFISIFTFAAGIILLIYFRNRDKEESA